MMKVKNFNKVAVAGDFLPLVIFIFISRFLHSWDWSFIISGLIAFAFVLFTFLSKEKQKNQVFALSVNLFLITGALMFLFNIASLQFVYKYFMYASIFIWIAIIGLIYTFINPEAYIGVKIQDPKKAKIMSLIMLGASVLAAVVALLFKQDSFYGAWLPFVSLLFLRDLFFAYSIWPDRSASIIIGENIAIIIFSLFIKKIIAKGFFISFLLLIIGKKLLRKFVRNALGDNRLG